MERTRRTSRPRIGPAGLLMVVIGLLAATLSRSLDGFSGGALAGAGIALLLLGVHQMSAARRPRRDPDGTPRSWLPSRDGRG